MSQAATRAALETSSASPVTVETHQAIAVVTLNRPRKHNALTVAMVDDLLRIFQDLSEDSTARAVVLRGEGPSFCAGQDVKEQRTVSESPRVAAEESLRRNIAAMISDCPLPTFAGLHGNALGRGADIALAADFRIASRDTKIGYPEVRHGMVMGGGGIERLVRCVGQPRAMQLLSFGRAVDADTAMAWGLVTEVVDGTSVDGRCVELASELIQYEELVLVGIKAAVRRAGDAGSPAGARMDAISNVLRRR